MLFVAARWSLMALSGHLRHRNILSAIGPKRTVHSKAFGPRLLNEQIRRNSLNCIVIPKRGVYPLNVVVRGDRKGESDADDLSYDAYRWSNGIFQLVNEFSSAGQWGCN
jgi:hypothetical protein